MKGLADFRAEAWVVARNMGEGMHNHASDHSRWFGSVSYAEGQAIRFAENADALTSHMHDVFDSLIPAVWVDRYLAERLNPLRDQAGLMTKLAGEMRQARDEHTDW